MPVSTRVISTDEADLRLDRWFRRHFPHITQAAVQKFCRTGQVRVDGGRVEANARLSPGQAIRIPPLPVGPAPIATPSMSPHVVKDLERMVIWRDELVLVLDKPFGLPVQGGPGIVKHLDGQLDGLRFGSEHRPRLVHRLDRDTSGVMLLARTPGAAAKLASAFRTRAAQKTYWAVVVGRPSPAEGRIDARLRRTGGAFGERTAVAERDDDEAVSALTDYRVLDAAGRRVSWLELNPLTGRTHQLRVHCEALGTPILGDIKYGQSATHVEGLPDLLHLHARALSIPHPAGGTLQIAAGLPPHMRETFQLMGFEAPAVPKPRVV